MTYIGQQPATTFDAGIQDRFTGLSSNTVTLTHEIAAEEDILVVWNNIVQDKNTYSVGGTGNKTLTLGGTLVSSDVVTVYYLNKVMQSVNPTANSVGITELNVSDGSNGQALTTNGSGTLSFATVSSVGGATGVDFNDSVEARFGTGNDFSIQHNASNTILAHTGTGDLQIRAIDSGKACIFYDHDASNEILKLTDTNGYLVSPPTAGLSSSQSANVYINSSGTFKKSTSALKYKKDVRDLESIDISSFRPVRYKSNINGEDPNEEFIGFIADEFHDAGLTELVSYGDDSDGKPTVVEGFNYDRITAVLTKALQEANKKIETLEAKVKALEEA